MPATFADENGPLLVSRWRSRLVKEVVGNHAWAALDMTHG